MPLARKIAIEAAGWTGAVFSLSAYSLNSLDLIESQSIAYLVMNIIGCAFLIIYAVCKKAYASWVLNGIWLLMTAVALVKIYGMP
ncbi:CBU_0592 family membrane protein [Flaviaesturariibacter amylovorans]|uniref:CBU-0592-like domain-containing protein n=1 Tax=Flaviaesturariibacter amylovorans TaxID=1084520 RepID=A0ABP8G5B8_9BACT